VDVNCDECFELHGVVLRHLFRRLADQHVQYVKETLVRRRHDLLIVSNTDQCFLRVTCPDDLKAQKTDLQQTKTIDNELVVKSNLF